MGTKRPCLCEHLKSIQLILGLFNLLHFTIFCNILALLLVSGERSRNIWSWHLRRDYGNARRILCFLILLCKAVKHLALRHLPTTQLVDKSTTLCTKSKKHLVLRSMMLSDCWGTLHYWDALSWLVHVTFIRNKATLVLEQKKIACVQFNLDVKDFKRYICFTHPLHTFCKLVVRHSSTSACYLILNIMRNFLNSYRLLHV